MQMLRTMRFVMSVLVAPWCDRRIVDDANRRTVVHAEDGRDADHVVTITSGVVTIGTAVEIIDDPTRVGRLLVPVQLVRGAWRNEGRRAIDERIRHRDAARRSALGKVAGGKNLGDAAVAAT